MKQWHDEVKWGSWQLYSKCSEQQIAPGCFRCARITRCAEKLANKLSSFTLLPVCYLGTDVLQASLCFPITFSLGLNLILFPSLPLPFLFLLFPTFLISPHLFFFVPRSFSFSLLILPYSIFVSCLKSPRHKVSCKHILTYISCTSVYMIVSQKLRVGSNARVAKTTVP